MYLQKFDKLNDLPQETIDSVPPLKDGETVIFRSLKKEEVIDAENGSKEIVYPALHIPFRDTIKVGGKAYRIGIPKDVQDDKVISFDSQIHGLGERFSGVFSVTGGSIEDGAKYMFYMLSNLRKDNPNRDKSFPALYELVDTKANAKNTTKIISQKLNALNIADNMSDGECRDFAASMNWNSEADILIIKADIMTYVDANYDEFLGNFQNKSTMEIKTIIKKAEEKGVIAFDATKYRVCWVTEGKNSAVIATLDKQEGVDWLTSFSEWAKTASNGAAVLKSLKKKVYNQEQD